MKAKRTRFLIPSCIALILYGVFADPASADDAFTAAPSSDLTRLNYYPHPDKLYVAPDIQFIPTDLSIPQVGDSPGNTTATQSWQADLNVIYGLPIEGLRLGVTVTWLWHRWADTTDSGTGAVNQADTDGLSDPTFELQYRLIDSAPTGLSWDADLIVSPSMTTHEVATLSDEGSDGKGYGTLSVTSNLYWISAMNDLGLVINLTYDFSGNGVNSTTPTASYNRDSVWTLTTIASDRFHFTRDFYAQASAAFDFPYSFNQTNQAATPVTRSFQFPFHINPSFQLGYRVKEKFVVDAIYTYQNYTFLSVPASPPNTSTHMIENTLELQAKVEL